MKKIKFNQVQNTEYVADDGWMFQWCCGCGLRHIWHFTIHDGDKRGGRFIEINGIDDRKGTELRKFYEKNK